MFNETLYRETFSRLQASGEAKKEVLLKMQEKKNSRRLPKALRTSLIAAVLVAALAVTANAATGGTLLGEVFHELTIVWSDGFHDIMVDEEGNEWNAYNVGAETELRDGRLILKAMGQEEDITDDLEQNGEAVRTFEQDGFDLTVTVTGTVEEPYIYSSSSDSLGVVSYGSLDDALDARGTDLEPGESVIMTGGEDLEGEITFGITNPQD